MQDVPVTGQSPWVRARTICPPALYRNLFFVFITFYQINAALFSGFARAVGLRSSCSLINWGRLLRPRCFKVLGAFSTAVSIVVESARFNQEITAPAFFPASGREMRFCRQAS